MRRVAAIVVIALAFASCVTPSIPIPPPEPERMDFELDVDLGTGTFAYPPDDSYRDAVVYVFNRTQGEGIITTARADGSVGPSDPFPAALDDEVAVTFETDVQVVSTCVVLRATGPRAECN